MNKKIFSLVGLISFLLLNIGIVLAQCPDSHPKYCSNVDLCYADWVDCNTIVYCKDNYYGCQSGKKLICYQGEAWCFDKCIDENTVAYCGDGIWGCWIDGCDPSKVGSVPTCYQGTYHCCPTDHPVYRADVDQCWKEGWECTSNDHCGLDEVCWWETHKCVPPPCNCPLPTTWSSCANGQMQRSIYICEKTTSYPYYNCVPQIETSKCGSECESDCTEHILVPSNGDYTLVYNCPTAEPETAFKSIKNQMASAWYYKEDTKEWFVWTPGEAPDSLDMVLCGETYYLKLTETAKFKCHQCTDGDVCLPVLTLGYNPTTGECKQFPTSCLDEGFTAVDKCPGMNGNGNGEEIDWMFYGLIGIIIIVIIVIFYLLVIKK